MKSQFRSLGLTTGRCPHDIADSYLLKMTPELWSGLTSFVCLQTFVLARCFDALTDGGSVIPTPECGNPNPYGRVCVYTVITNGFSSVYCACTILKSRGQRYPCHFLCQRSWVTCGKDIDQGRLIYVPAIVSTVDFLFLFMSCALFLRSRIWVR